MTKQTPAQVEGGGDPETAALAITYLQAQLSQATGAYDGLDQKATLLPVFLAGTALLMLPSSGEHFDFLQIALLAPALATGGIAVYYTAQALKTKKLPAGPEPKDVAEKMYRPLAEFTPALAGIIAEAIGARRSALSTKAKAFNRAMYLAAVTLILITVARLIGGLTVKEQSSDSQTLASPPSTAPATAPVTPAPSATDSPVTPAPTVSVGPTTSDADAGTTTLGMAFEAKGNLDPGSIPDATTGHKMFEIAYEERSAADPQPTVIRLVADKPEQSS